MRNLFCEDLLFSFVDGEISNYDGNVLQFGLDLYISSIVFGLLMFGSLCWLPFVILV